MLNINLRKIDIDRNERTSELVVKGLAANLSPELVVASSDALKDADPDSATERVEHIAREEASDALYCN